MASSLSHSSFSSSLPSFAIVIFLVGDVPEAFHSCAAKNCIFELFPTLDTCHHMLFSASVDDAFPTWLACCTQEIRLVKQLNSHKGHTFAHTLHSTITNPRTQGTNLGPNVLLLGIYEKVKSFSCFCFCCCYFFGAQDRWMFTLSFTVFVTSYSTLCDVCVYNIIPLRTSCKTDKFHLIFNYYSKLTELK